MRQRNKDLVHMVISLETGDIELRQVTAEEVAELTGTAVDRARIEALARDPQACSLEAITEAVARVDHEDAAARCIARVRAGLGLPAEVMCAVLPGIADDQVFLGLIALASGDRAQALLRLVVEHRFRADPLGGYQAAIALYAAWHFGEPAELRPLLIPPLRRQLRTLASLHDAALVTALVRELDDPQLDQLARDHAPGSELAELDATIVAFVDGALDRTLDEVLAHLPDRASPPGAAPRVPRRKVGRNEPCPCGSGTKYKRCCDAQLPGSTPRLPSTMSWFASVIRREAN